MLARLLGHLPLGTLKFSLATLICNSLARQRFNLGHLKLERIQLNLQQTQTVLTAQGPTKDVTLLPEILSHRRLITLFKLLQVIRRGTLILRTGLK
jgi:hypothetical protein